MSCDATKVFIELRDVNYLGSTYSNFSSCRLRFSDIYRF